MRIIIAFIFLILQSSLPTYAADLHSLPDASPLMESAPQSKEIKKIAKLLENPEEREKLIKTLKVFAATQEAEEKKKEQSFLSHFTQLAERLFRKATNMFKEVERIPGVVESFVDQLKAEHNRHDVGLALLWLPLLWGMSFVFRAIHIQLFKYCLKGMASTEKAVELAQSKNIYVGLSLFLPYLYAILFLPLFVSNSAVGSWVSSFWIIWFIIRLFFVAKTTTPVMPVEDLKAQNTIRNSWQAYAPFGAIVLLFISAITMSKYDTKVYGNEFVVNIFIFMVYPFLVLYFREWRAKVRPTYIEESRALPTAPAKMAPLINFFIYYVPWVILLLGVLLVIDRAFLDGDIWEIYGIESLLTLAALEIFLIARKDIDTLSRYKMPKFQTHQMQTFAAYLSLLLFPLAKALQWILYILFFGGLLLIWNYCFSGMIVNIIFHSLTKTGVVVLSIWAVIYFLWISLDFFVQFHTKPQIIKGKRREPTAFAKTFGPMLQSVARWIIVLVAFFITLESFGFDLKILVYLMSAFALAISLGAQSLVKDVINGFFALIDGSFAVGEVVTVGAHTGTVESLSLRALTLRHSNGYLQSIPFSEVGNIINRSRDYNVVPITVTVSYKAKIGDIYKALKKAAEEITEHPVFGKMIIEPLSISGIDHFAETAIHVSASMKIVPDPTGNFAREYNNLLKANLDALKVAPPITYYEEWGRD